jgi:hypothetical protein
VRHSATTHFVDVAHHTMKPKDIDNVVLLTIGELFGSGALRAAGFSQIGKEAALKPRPEHAEPLELVRSNIPINNTSVWT